MALPPKLYQFLVSVFASVGSILYGYDLGVIAGAIASDNFKAQFNPSAAEEGAVVSVLYDPQTIQAKHNDMNTNMLLQYRRCFFRCHVLWSRR